ncbi:MAG: alpha/beta fold hydrolase [Oculatellaceae cyanobacterium Prado106]|jgi:alpha-beta hydrolase superfamily lysophospholipase|nr:alpha/beta fold hydrolase [Oculatellaceae cyanobacterium Prado106]
MVNYTLATAAILEQAKQEEEMLPLRNAQCRSRFYFHNRPTEVVCLFFHGFTAGPYQFEPLAKACYDAGYNVLIPRLPGHGQAGDWNWRQPPPLPTDPAVYQRAVAEWVGIAKMLGDRLVVGGLSTGGTLAAWSALNYPHLVDRALLFAPFMGARFGWVDELIKHLPIYFEWFNKNASGNFGYKGFRLPALKLFLKMRDRCFKQVHRRPAPPMLMVCSEADQVTSRQKQQQFFQSAVRYQPQSWYYSFDKRYKIRHRMMTRIEGNRYEDLVVNLAKAYISQVEQEEEC